MPRPESSEDFLSRIKSGLTTTTPAPSTGPVDDLSAWTGAFLAPADITARGEAAGKVAAFLADCADGVDAGLARKRESLEIEHRSLPPDVRRQVVDNQITQYRKTAFETGRAEREAKIAELRQSLAVLEKAEYFFSSPQVIASRHLIGTRERNDMMASLNGCGPAVLEHYGKLAIARGDKLLSACVAEAVARLPARERRVSPQAVAGVFKAEYETAQASIKFARAKLAEAVAAERRIATGRRDGTSKIAADLAKASYSPVLNDDGSVRMEPAS